MSLRGQPPRPRRGRPAGGGLRRQPSLPSPRSGWTPRRIRRAPAFGLPTVRLPALHLPSLAGLPRPARRGFSPVRAAALLVVLLAAGGLYGAGASDAFGYGHLELSGLAWTSEATVRSLVGVPDGTNLFTIRTGPIADRVAVLPPVAAVRVEILLPGTLAVRITERVPVLVWRVGQLDYVVDRDGTVFARLGPEAEPPDLPVVEDGRAAAAGSVRVGAPLDPVDVDAATRLASLVPADVGSAAARLAVSITDANGFVVRSQPAGWTAVFGFYTPSLRKTDLIPGQVRLLRSLLEGREALVERVILADDRNGTFVPRATPAATPVPSTAP